MSKDDLDTKWWDEKNQQGSKISINHRGLMPSCSSCGAKFKLARSDRGDTPFRADHPKNGCPFIKSVYGKSELECINQLRGAK